MIAISTFGSNHVTTDLETLSIFRSLSVLFVIHVSKYRQQKEEIIRTFISSANKIRSNVPVSKSVLNDLWKLPIDLITTSGCTSRNNSTGVKNSPTQYCNYDKEVINNFAQLKIKEIELAHQTIKFEYAELLTL